MKKLLFVILATVSFSFTSQAQVLLSEDFDSGFPAGWQRINNDGLIPHASVAYVTDAWTYHEALDSVGTGDSILINTSYYSPAGTADDWLILPPVTLQPSGNFLEWQVKSEDPSYPDGYEVWVTNTNPVIDSLVTGVQIFYTDFELPDWVTRTYSLDTFANQTVHIAFRATSDDQFLLLLDDIRVYADSTAAVNNISADDASVVVYPNPVSDRLFIHNKGNERYHHLNIFDMTGRLIYADEMEGMHSIDCSSFTPGVYFLRLSNEHKSVTRKFIVK